MPRRALDSDPAPRLGADSFATYLRPRMIEPDSEPETERSRGAALAVMSRTVRAHPVVTAVLVSCALGGAILGVQLLTPDWSLARRLAGGLVGGAGVGLLITATRMIG